MLLLLFAFKKCQRKNYSDKDQWWAEERKQGWLQRGMTEMLGVTDCSVSWLWVPDCKHLSKPTELHSKNSGLLYFYKFNEI